jgi:O-antigen chain-terminating methyltransferase
MKGGFYKAFEERYRGSRESIALRLRAYLPFVQPLVQLQKGAQTLDLGCGRGEWLELMGDIGFSAYGVDLDEGMLEDCHEHDLSAEQGDAIAYLKQLPDDSHAIISAFHFVEHISFDQLHIVVSEALRVLKSGGLLVMETPNPENIIVATRNFYLDPSHLRPIPPQLLSFLPEYYGFARTKTIRLQESMDLLKSKSVTLNDVFGGVSPDYAVIAQKAAPAETLELFDKIFNQEYGLTLDTIALRYDTVIAAKTEYLETLVAQQKLKAHEAYTKSEENEKLAVQAETKAIEALSRSLEAEKLAAQSEAKSIEAYANSEEAIMRAEHAEKEWIKVCSSFSWRITAPVRWINSLTRRIMDGIKAWVG